jgi:hypothetical protein
MPDADRDLRNIMRMLDTVYLDGNNHHARQVHMHPNDFTRFARHNPAPGDYARHGNINALLGLDVITRSGQPEHTYRITDQHGCLLFDSRSGKRVHPTPGARP